MQGLREKEGGDGVEEERCNDEKQQERQADENLRARTQTRATGGQGITLAHATLGSLYIIVLTCM